MPSERLRRSAAAEHRPSLARVSLHTRPLARLTAACLLLWGGVAQALTLGPAVVNSSLGEPLRAEFPITRLSATESQNLQVRLADEKAYAAARLERSSVLEGLDLSLDTRPDGRRVLVVRGQQAVNAPFVDLLVELRWNGGRLLRDLTVLLQAQATDKPASLPPSGLVVQAGDTAGQLARDHKTEQVSLEQMLVALLKQNPDAFIDGNVNRLRAGALLALPSAAEAGGIEQDAAREALLEQADAFDAWRAGLSQRVTASDAPDAAESNRLQMPSRQRPAAGAPQDRLELTKPGAGQEDRIALQRQAQDTAERAAELARNIAELGKIAGANASDGTASSGVPLPSPDVPPHGRLIDILRDHPLTPIGAATLVAVLVLMSLWRTRVRNAPSALAKAPAELPPSPSLTPLPIEVDLELPRYDSPLADDTPSVQIASARGGSAGAASPATPPPPTGTVTTLPGSGTPAAPRPTSGLPFAGLSLELSDTSAAPAGQFPFDPATDNPALRVRLELAQALWEAGQPHTARALAEDVVEQAQGALQQQARAWLAARA